MSSQRPPRQGSRAAEQPSTAKDGATPALAVEGVSSSDRSGTRSRPSTTCRSASTRASLRPRRESGSGKSTLAEAVLGLAFPDPGGSSAGYRHERGPRAAYRHVDGMLEGARNDYWRLTVRENPRFPRPSGRQAGCRRRPARATAGATRPPRKPTCRFETSPAG